MNGRLVEFKELGIPMDEREMISLLKHLEALSKGGTRVRDAYKPYLIYDENKKKHFYYIDKKDEFLNKIGLFVGKLF